MFAYTELSELCQGGDNLPKDAEETTYIPHKISSCLIYVDTTYIPHKITQDFLMLKGTCRIKKYPSVILCSKI